MLDIKIVRTTEPKAKPQDESSLASARFLPTICFLMDYTAGEGCMTPALCRMPLADGPATVVFHYATGNF